MSVKENNFVENVVNAQKQVLDTVVENTKKFAQGNSVVNDTVEKGSEWYKNWLDTQKSVFAKATEQTTQATETVKEKVKENTSKANEFFENWFNWQMEGAKKVWEMASNAQPNNAFNFSNPFQANPFTTNWNSQFSNMNNQWQNMSNNWTNWMGQGANMNPFNADAFKKPAETMTEMFNQYFKTMSAGFENWQKNFNVGNIQDAYKAMINTGEGFTKFAELWTPMFKSIQDKTFNMDVYKNFINPELYRDMMDKYLGMFPESVREQYNSFNQKMKEGGMNMADSGLNAYNQMSNAYSKALLSSSNMFGGVNTAYNSWYSQMSEFMGPFHKLATPNKHTKMLAAWNDINDMIVNYNIKNAEMQFMIYNQGQKVMDKLAENVTKKVKEGTEVKSMLGLYQEWLNISDKVFVGLFESDEYSKIMAEVGALQMKIRSAIDAQFESAIEELPIAKRSELDNVYKLVHDLKKQVNDLNKQIAALEASKETVEEKPAKAAKKA